MLFVVSLVYLSLRQSCIVLITMYVESGRDSSLAIVLQEFLSPLHFHINFRINLSSHSQRLRF